MTPEMNCTRMKAKLFQIISNSNYPFRRDLCSLLLMRTISNWLTKKLSVFFVEQIEIEIVDTLLLAI